MTRRQPQWRKIIRSTYIDFPKVNLPHALTDMIRELLIVFFILLFYNKSVLGSYDFSFKMLKLPLTIIGSAIGQVYFQKIAIKRNNGRVCRQNSGDFFENKINVLKFILTMAT